MSNFPVWDAEPVQQVCFFTDGSSYKANRHDTHGEIAGWAFVILLQCEVDSKASYRFYGVSYGQLTQGSTPHASSQSVGELVHDAMSAEAVAMIWAMAWLARSPFAAHTVYYYDNMTIGRCAAGQGL